MLNEYQKKELFKLYPVLSKVEHELLERSLSGAKLITLQEGTRIFDELQPCNTFPFILSGKIRVFKQSVSGRELSLYNVESGDTCIVTTGCLLGNTVYNASGTVKEDTDLIMLASNAFDDLLNSPAFREFIFSLISKRISELMQLVEEVAFHNLDKRLASLLMQQGKELNTSHQELADELGTVREIITRLLHSFSDTGLIRLRRGRMDILDKSALQNILEN